MVCKLVQLDGVPIIKLSASKGKMTLPGNKKLFRVQSGTIEGSEARFDIIGTEEDTQASLESGELILYSLYNDFKT